MSKLVVALSASVRVPHELAEELITIGRGAENQIQLEDPSVSGRHAQLQARGDSYELQDLQSTNGTQVNGKAIAAPVLLRVGDQIRFGKVEACFECETPGTAQPLPSPEQVQAAPAELSARPADFANASPFPRRTKQKDPARLALFAAAGLAILALLASLLSLLQMRPPMP